jgi:uncharacterized protein YbdZ (MbtH family)
LFTCLDLAASNWTTLAPLPLALSGHTVVSDTVRLYVTGGLTDIGIGAGVFAGKCVAYDIARDCWHERASPGVARVGHSAVMCADGRRMLVTGGSTGSMPIATPQLYDTVANTWHDATPSSLKRRRSGALLIDGFVYVMGGETWDAATDEWLPTREVERYDPIADSWSPGPWKLPERVSWFSVHRAGDHLMVAGGARLVNGDIVPNPQVHQLTLSMRTWRTIQAPDSLSVSTKSSAYC